MSVSTNSISPELPEFEGFSNDLLQELKVRARLRLNALHSNDDLVLSYARFISKRRRWPMPPEWKLQHALNIVASELGFRDWQHARVVLAGTAKRGDDMGGFWYPSNGVLLLNHWFARYEEAKELHCQGEYWLLPYAKQFVAVDRNYLRELSLDPQLPLWEEISRDLVACYGDERWHRLCALRLMSTRGLPPPKLMQF